MKDLLVSFFSTIPDGYLFFVSAWLIINGLIALYVGALNLLTLDFFMWNKCLFRIMHGSRFLGKVLMVILCLPSMLCEILFAIAGMILMVILTILRFLWSKDTLKVSYTSVIETANEIFRPTKAGWR